MIELYVERSTPLHLTNTCRKSSYYRVLYNIMVIANTMVMCNGSNFVRAVDLYTCFNTKLYMYLVAVWGIKAVNRLLILYLFAAWELNVKCELVKLLVMLIILFNYHTNL